MNTKSSEPQSPQLLMIEGGEKIDLKSSFSPAVEGMHVRKVDARTERQDVSSNSLNCVMEKGD